MRCFTQIHSHRSIAHSRCSGAEQRSRQPQIGGSDAGRDGLAATNDEAVPEWAADQAPPTCDQAAVGLVSAASNTACRAPSLAARTFTNALCRCEDTNIAGYPNTAAVVRAACRPPSSTG